MNILRKILIECTFIYLCNEERCKCESLNNHNIAEIYCLPHKDYM